MRRRKKARVSSVDDPAGVQNVSCVPEFWDTVATIRWLLSRRRRPKVYRGNILDHERGMQYHRKGYALCQNTNSGSFQISDSESHYAASDVCQQSSDVHSHGCYIDTRFTKSTPTLTHWSTRTPKAPTQHPLPPGKKVPPPYYCTSSSGRSQAKVRLLQPALGTNE
jgi:hypothetical protein